MITISKHKGKEVVVAQVVAEQQLVTIYLKGGWGCPFPWLLSRQSCLLVRQESVCLLCPLYKLDHVLVLEFLQGVLVTRHMPQGFCTFSCVVFCFLFPKTAR